VPATTFKIFRYQPDAAKPEPFYQDTVLVAPGQRVDRKSTRLNSSHRL